MGIYEHLVNHMLNKYKTILLSSLHVIKVFLHIYFGDYDPQFSTLLNYNPTILTIVLILYLRIQMPISYEYQTYNNILLVQYPQQTKTINLSTLNRRI